MIASTKPAEARDAILGVMPHQVCSPTDLDECAAFLAQTDREKQRLAFIGGGTELALGGVPKSLDVVVRSQRMARIIEYAPADMVIAVEAGVTLEQLQAAAREHGQRLALDPPEPERATIGGLVATAAYGPRRARFGAIRDLIIGVTLVRADGVVAHGGGKVVKNVAGFDLPKLACGSLGTLGMIARATFRLHPLPEASATARVDGLTAGGVFALVAAAREAQLEPTSVVALRASDATWRLGFRFEGFEKGVKQQMQRLLSLTNGDHPRAALTAEEAAAFWKRHDDTRSTGSLRVKVATLPSRLNDVDSLLALLLAALRGGSFAWYATLGFGFVSGEISDVDAALTSLRAARTALAGGGGSLVIQAAPPELRRAIDPWGPAPVSFPIMNQLRQHFDPQRRLNPGRFVND